jgi:hypothetical protein
MVGRFELSEDKMNELKAQEPVFRATIEVKRAATGKVETYELIGTPIENEQPAQTEEEKE